MCCRTVGRGMGLLLALIAVFLLLPSQGFAQTSSSSSSTTSSINEAGVLVDAEGVLRTKIYTDSTGQLTWERIQGAKAALNPKVATYSKLRKISLNRLEQSIISHQNVINDEMRNLAGLQRIRYVFYYPESKDIVLAGPAEGWVTDLAGRVVGLSSGRPVVQLQDLVVGLRAFPSKGKATQLIGCSIDPTPEGLAALQQFIRSVGSNVNPDQTEEIVEGTRTSLGMHNITVNGISPKTHFAQVLVEADYRMKLIGIGVEKPPVKLISYADRANAGDVSRSALQRWFFVPDYQCVRVSNDQTAMELVGDGVKLVGESEMVSGAGERNVTGGFNKASQAFVTNFTKVYPELAQRSPIYAELRNVIDISIAAAFIQQQDYYGKAGWNMEFFGNEKLYSVETYNIPKTVETVVNAIWKGGRLMTPVGGGVQIRAEMALESEKILGDEKGKVEKAHNDVKVNLTEGQWWWD